MPSLFIGLFLKYKHLLFDKFKKSKPLKKDDDYTFPNKTSKAGFQLFPNGMKVLWGQTEKSKQINEPLPIEIKDVNRSTVQISTVEKAFYAVFDSTSNVIGKFTPYKSEVISELKHLRSNGKTGWIKRIYPFYKVVELSNKELIISSTHPVRLNYLIMEY